MYDPFLMVAIVPKQFKMWLTCYNHGAQIRDVGTLPEGRNSATHPIPCLQHNYLQPGLYITI